MPDKPSSRVRYAEAFWRAHHEAWIQSDLNQREYCETYGLPLKPSLPSSWGPFRTRRFPVFSLLFLHRKNLSKSL